MSDQHKPRAPRKVGSIASRLTIVATIWVLALLTLGGMSLSILLSRPLLNGFEKRVEGTLDSLIAVTTITPVGQITVPNFLDDRRFAQKFSGWYWQIVRRNDSAILARSMSMANYKIRGIDSLVPGVLEALPAAGPLEQNLSALVKQVTYGDGEIYLFAVAADSRGLMANVSRIDWMLFWSLSMLGTGLLLGVFLQVYFGLSPLRRLRLSLADIREGRAEKLTGEYPSEINPLVHEMNGLLRHTSAVLERARWQIGNLAHTLKTPLAVITNESAHPSELSHILISEQSALIRSQINHYLARDKTIVQAPLMRNQTSLKTVIEPTARTIEKLYQDKNVEVFTEVAAELSFRGEKHDLMEVIGNLADNAGKWCEQRIDISAQAEPAKAGGFFVKITVEDDGPGIPQEMRRDILARGKRIDESKPGTGIGLAMVQQIVTLYGGEINLSVSPLGGLRASVILPGHLQF